MVYIILGDGFEEAEALIPCDLLRRAEVAVCLAGIGGMEVTGGHGITVRADCRAEEADLTGADMLVLPGGLGGVASIRKSRPVLDALRAVSAKGGYIAAICAAPTILAELGITDGRKATCYPGMESQMGEAGLCACDVAVDGKVITGRAAGAAFDFGLALIEALRGRSAAEEIAAGVVYRT